MIVFCCVHYALGVRYAPNQEICADLRSMEVAFSRLPLELQASIFALASAPLSTCRASASVAGSPALTATWLAASSPNPLAKAARFGLLEVCRELLARGTDVRADDDEALR
jgi:hypothetical protein